MIILWLTGVITLLSAENAEPARPPETLEQLRSMSLDELSKVDIDGSNEKWICTMICQIIAEDFGLGYRQRSQVETTISMIKRNLGSCLGARLHWSKVREMSLKALTHNVAIVHALRAFLQSQNVPFFPSLQEARPHLSDHARGIEAVKP